jgi:DNA polymerase (family 10)
MALDNRALASRLDELAMLLELHGENAFRVRAFSGAARQVKGLQEPVAERLAAGTLRDVKGIGPAIAEVLAELVASGDCALHRDLLARTPGGLLELLDLPGLGPRKVRAIHEGLGIQSLGELEYACLENRLVTLEGFGPKTQDKILAAIAFHKRHRGLLLAGDLRPPAERLQHWLSEVVGVLAVLPAGSFARRLEVVERVDFVVVGMAAEGLAEALKRLSAWESGDSGDSVLTGRFEGVCPVRLVTVAAADAGWTQLTETGSPAFLEALEASVPPDHPVGRRFRGEAAPVFATEAEVFAALGLAVVPPELREDGAIVARAREGRLPDLVTPEDLAGVFHVHTTDSDGSASVEAMARAALARGWSYLGISDHSEAATYARGLDRERLALQRAEIARVQRLLPEIRLFHGIEADILPDGSLDYDDETLLGFDFVVASIHQRAGLDREAMTARLVRAASHPCVTMLGHLTGRLLLAREPYAFDLEPVLEAAAANGVAIELNANPHRLDLDWRDVPAARARGLAIAINPDAHSIPGLDDTRFGIDMARKAGLSAPEILNSRSAAEMEGTLEARRLRARQALLPAGS